MQRDGVSEIAESPEGDPGELRLRRLGYGDLPAVIAIERRAFPTPWSLAMFVLELSKPSGVCLAAFVDESTLPTSGAAGPPAAAGRPPPARDRKLVGYRVCSRFDTVWHIMNVAVDPGRRRHGSASTLLTR